MSEEQTAVATRSNSSSEVGAMSDVLEDFAWRFDEKLAPARLKVRSYALKSNFQRRIASLQDEAEANARAYSTLKTKQANLKADLLAFDDDDDLDRREFEEKERKTARLEEVEAQLAELEDKPRTSNEVVVEEGFLKIIAEWDLTDNGVPIPLTKEGVLSLSSVVFNKLWEDLGDFLSPTRRKKKRV